MLVLLADRFTIQQVASILACWLFISERVAEFSALVDYLGPKGEFHHHEHAFVSAIMRADSRHRRSEAETILMQENWEGVNLAKDLCVACIPYATAGTLREIGSFTAGCS